MNLRAWIFGLLALASLSGAAVAFLWQGILYFQNESWPKLSVASALRSASPRCWARLAHAWPDGLAALDASPLALALLGVAVLGYAIMKWGSNR